MTIQKTHIAVISSYGLGDSLIFLIIANNLLRNDFHVTFYSSHVCQLSGWLSGIELKPFPPTDDIDAFFDQYDLVLTDFVSFIADLCPVEKKAELTSRAVFVGMSRVPDMYINFRPEKLLEKITDNNICEKLLPFCKASGCHISKLSQTESMAGRVKIFCEEILKLKNVTKENGIKAPKELLCRKNKKRIILHPESREEAKNWWPGKFIKLAKKLDTNGFKPVFIVAPDERKKWGSIIKNQFEMPIFKNLDQLARYVFESGYMIGNDSGIGHLASNLGIPTLTITKATNKNYRWRPGWAKGVLINAPFQAKFKEKYFWQFFVSVNKVYNAFEKSYGDLCD